MKKTVFISSTFKDLKNHRRKIWELLEGYDVNIRGMESFGARKDTPLTTSLSEVEQSDIYIGIIAYRLGKIDEASGKSITQREYERASELEREILVYMIDEKDSLVSYQNIDFGKKREKLNAFKSILKERHTVDFFVNEDDLEEKIRRKFDEILTPKEAARELGIDEYKKSKELVDKFSLLPKNYSGQEAKLKIDFVDKPFPASKLLCTNFNLEFGKTIGIKIKIKEPQLATDTFEYSFMDEDKLNVYFSLEKQNDIEIYGKLQFSENNVDKVEANFVRKEYRVGWFGHMNISTLTLGETKVIEADGITIIKLSKILN